MKIAIIGSGVSGLCFYLNLQKLLARNSSLKNRVDISLFESHDPKGQDKNATEEGVPSSGGGYGLAANGMAALRRLDPRIHERVLKNGYPTPRFQLKAATGTTLGCIPTTDVRNGHAECCVMVLRQHVIEALQMNVPPSAVSYRKVVDVEDATDQATLTFADGGRATFDLVIGADGVWSRARRAILGEKFPAEYKGLFTVGGFVPTDYLPKLPESGQVSAPVSHTTMIFGPNGFFGIAPYTTAKGDVTPAQIKGEVLAPPGRMAFWWSRSVQADPRASLDDATLRQELLERHKSWKNATLHRVLENSLIPLKVPTWVHPIAPKWAGRRVVLIGDAAHALPSSSGQGVSQALEDAEALAKLLVYHLSTFEEATSQWESKVLRTTFEQFEKVRKKHVEAILAAGNRAGDMSRDLSKIAEYTMYAFFWVVGRYIPSIFTKAISEYDVVAEIEKVKQRTL